jgi:hypothetical protein
MNTEKKHFVLTHMDENQDRSETEAFYQGEYEIDQFPVKVSYWKDDYLIVPSWFDTEKAAQEYIKNVYEHISADFYMVQERHYAKGDPRIANAKIIGSIKDVDFCPQPSRGKTQEKSGEPMIDVWTMWFRGLDLAEQYVNVFNKDIAAAKAISNIPCSPFPGLPHGM